MPRNRPAASVAALAVKPAVMQGYVGSGLGYFAGLVASVFLVGGWLHLRLFEAAPPPDVSAAPALFIGLCAATAVLVALFCGWRLRVGNRRAFGFGTIALAIVFPLMMAIGEGAARIAAPPWPAIGLHGVDPAQGGAWARASARPGAVGLNSWGQRDLPRTLHPRPGVRRVAFIGDSFLEESSTIPVSVRVEQRLKGDNVEVLNLGVSASGPEEYFHRMERIGLPLGVQHCVLFIFAGNDFVDAEVSLPTAYGIAAVYPRGSFLQSFGLLGLNHLLINRQRPVIQAWLTAGDLQQKEQARRDMLARLPDERLRETLATGFSQDGARRLQLQLAQPVMEEFYAMLRAPDEGLFRSYYLVAALSAAANPGPAQWAMNSGAAALHWVSLTAELCRQRGVDFTLVIIPEAFQVDSRMQKQWLPLADMRHLTRPTRDAARLLAERARAAKIDTLDLHVALQDLPGTYLNLDGHWSDHGVEVVSQLLADKFATRKQ